MADTLLIDQLVRVFLGSALSFALAMVLLPLWSDFLYKIKFWKVPKEETLYGTKAVVFQQLHAEKHQRHIPTMAGIMVLLPIVLVTIFINLTRSQTYLTLFSLAAAGLLGVIDDYVNVRGVGGIKGIRAKHRLVWLFLIAALGAWWFYFKLGKDVIHIPYLAGFFHLGLWFIPLFIFIIMATANAINITDGLDGLSGGLLIVAYGAYGALALAGGQISLAIFCGTVVGAILAYLWFNIYPARFFGGDSYATALGATLGVVAALIPNGVGIVILPLIAFVPLVETLSSLLQLLWRRIFKRKLFKIAPLHHHLEALGWPEPQVTMRFWVLGAVFAIIGIVIGLIGKG
jgi:phospho-N-acetylmuramoyl-pentapeptide-transferase